MEQADFNQIGLCLASHSPRRRRLLESLGVQFFVRAASSDVEEEVVGEGRGQEAEFVALARAEAKGKAVAEELSDYSGSILSSDTVVHIGHEILDKPVDAEEARSFLKRLSGSQHGVVSAVWLRHDSREYSIWRRTFVRFAELQPETIEAYISTGEPFDKAGGYGIQGVGGALVESITGCYFNVMGLPLNATAELFSKVGLPWCLGSSFPTPE